MRASAIVPRPALRALDRVRTRRFLGTTAPPTREYVRRHGLTVRHGPFAGMHYLEGLEASSGDLVAKLTGTYERELHGVIGEWISARPHHIVDIGAAEGYYAVGLALAIPDAHVHAFDIDALARERCGALAALNGVAGRVHVAGECEPTDLEGLPADGVALLSDCEGAERELLDPARVPGLTRWPILVELHDFIDPSISSTITSRFRASHEIEIIDGTDRENPPTEVAFMSARQRAAVLSERRPGPMQWAYMRPRTAPS